MPASDLSPPAEPSPTREESPDSTDRGRREFIKQACILAAAAAGLPSTAALKFAEAATRAGLKPCVILLHFQECTGCTESLLRTTRPDLAKLILDMVSLDYHETLLTGAGRQAEACLHQAMEEHRG